MAGLRETVRDLTGPVVADLLETDDAYLLLLDLPGATPEETSVSTRDGVLHVVAHREKAMPDDATVVREERPQTLEVELPLPSDVLDEGASASIADGVMEVTLPRGVTETTIPIEDE